MQATPTLWQALVTEYPEKLQGLNVLVGGEALPAHLAKTLKRIRLYYYKLIWTN